MLDWFHQHNPSPPNGEAQREEISREQPGDLPEAPPHHLPVPRPGPGHREPAPDGDPMSTYTTATRILMQDTSGDRIEDTWSAAFMVAEIAYAFDINEAIGILGVGFGTPPAKRDELRPMMAQCYGGDHDPATARARDLYRPEFVELFFAVDEGTISPEELVFTAKVINRYLSLVNRARDIEQGLT